MQRIGAALLALILLCAPPQWAAHASNLTLLGVGGPAADPAPTLVNDFAVGDPARKVANGTSGNIRSTPGGTLIGAAPSGGYCPVSGPAALALGAWYWLIQCFNGDTGYMADVDLEPAIAPPQLLPLNENVVVITASTNIRSSPGGTSLGQQPVGATATIVGGPRYEPNSQGDSDWWYQVSGFVQAPTAGWIVVERLAVDTSGPGLDIVPPTPNVVVNVTGGMTGGTGAAGSLQNCINAAGTGIVTECDMPATAINVGSSVTYTIPANKTIIVEDLNMTYTASVTVAFQGSFETTFTVSTLGLAGGLSTIQVSGGVPAGWAVGDVVKVFSLNNPVPTARVGSSGVNNSRLGEHMQIQSINTSTGVITLAGQLVRHSSYTSGLRVARMVSGKLWLVRPRITGQLAHTAIQLRITRLKEARIIERVQRTNGGRFLFVSGSWNGIDWKPDCANGGTDLSVGGSDCVDMAGTKNWMMASDGSITNCTDTTNCADEVAADQVAGSTDPGVYGHNLFSIFRGLRIVADETARESRMTTHAGAYGGLYEDIITTLPTAYTQYCISYRGEQYTFRDVTCNGTNARGIQIGVGCSTCSGGVDGQAGSLSISDSDFNVPSGTADINNAATLDAATFSVTNTTCNAPMSSQFTKVNSPGC